MTVLAMYLGVAAIGYAIAFRFRLPSIPVLMVLGFGLSLLPFAPDREYARYILELGLAFLLFSAGIELSPRRFLHQTGAVLWVALTQFFLVGFIGTFAAKTLGYNEISALYIGFALSASSTLIVVRHLRKRQQMFQPFGRLVTGVLLVQDIALILLLTLLSSETSGDPETRILAPAGLVVLSGIAVFCHYWLFPRLVKKLLSDEETLLLLALATLFGFVGCGQLLKVPFVAGAFLAGFSLSSFPINGLLRGLIGSLADFFQALFFTVLGSLIVLSGGGVLAHAVLLAAMVFLVTPPIVTWVAERCGQSSRSGIESGLLLAQTSELGVVFALIGWNQGHLGDTEFTLIAVVAALTMTVTPLVANDRFTWRLLRWHPGRRKPLSSLPLEGHILVLGFGKAGMWSVKPFLDAGYSVIVVDDDPMVVSMLSRTKVVCLRGDGSDVRMLEMLQARKAHMIVAAVPKLGDLLNIIRYARGVRVLARVQEEDEAQEIEKAGGVAIRNAVAAEGEFLKWFESNCCAARAEVSG